MAKSPGAVIFDLYGTLLYIGRRRIPRDVPRLLGLDARTWMHFVRTRLLVSPFGGPDEFVDYVFRNVAHVDDPGVKTACLKIVEDELESVGVTPGVGSLLAFLKGLGLKIGILSNLSSLHKEPLSRHGINQQVDASFFSCDEGVMKPDPRAYVELARRLGVAPAETLVVGDSLRNDVLAPRELGMRAIHITGDQEGNGLASVADLAWRSLQRPEDRLIGENQTLVLRDGVGAVRQIELLSDADQGRFNLVGRARYVPTDEACDSRVLGGQDLFVKRYRFPEAAYVEEFMYTLHKEIRLPSCEAIVLDTTEPVLVVTAAPGRKLDGSVDPVLAFELGRHCAAGYLFSNADLRPRNAIVSYEDGRPAVTMIDLEHCLFNLALDTSGIAEPLRPDTFDRLPSDEIEKRVRRRVLTERTTRRAMGTFLRIEREYDEVGRAFRDGWLDTFAVVKSEASRLCKLILTRIRREPFLVIGTKSYRRAMAAFDVDDIRSRIDQDPREIFPRLAAFTGESAAQRERRS